MNTEAIKAFIELRLEKATLKTRLSIIEEEIRKAERPIIDGLANEGVDRITLDGFTVSTRRNLRGSAGGNMPGLIRALKSVNLDVLVSETVNASRLTAWVKEFDEHSNMSPVEVRAEIEAEHGTVAAAAIRITETFTLGMVKS